MYSVKAKSVLYWIVGCKKFNSSIHSLIHSIYSILIFCSFLARSKCTLRVRVAAIVAVTILQVISMQEVNILLAMLRAVYLRTESVRTFMFMFMHVVVVVGTLLRGGGPTY